MYYIKDMILRFTILILSILLTGPGLEVSKEGSISERLECLEVSVQEACELQTIRIAKRFRPYTFIKKVVCIRPGKISTFQSRPVNSNMVIQLHQLLI